MDKIARELISVAQLLAASKFPYEPVESGQKAVRELRDSLKKTRSSEVQREIDAAIKALNDAYGKLSTLRQKARKQGI